MDKMKEIMKKFDITLHEKYTLVEKECAIHSSMLTFCNLLEEGIEIRS